MRKIKNRAKALLYAQGPGRFYAPAYRNLAESMRGDEGPFLDLGCGTGALVRALANCRPDTSVVGIDRNPSAVQEAADGHRDLQHVQFREMHAESLEFEAGAFGTVSAVQNLMHWKELSAVLGEAHRVLRPDGALIIFQAGGAGPIPEEWLDRPMGWPPVLTGNTAPW